MNLHLRWRRNPDGRSVCRMPRSSRACRNRWREAEGFRGPQVCALIGITYRQLDYWARTGLLRPSIADARGSGTQRLYSYTDVVELKVIKQLLDAGISLQRARRAVECLRDGLGGDLASSNLVLVGTDSVLAHTDGEVVDLLKGGQGVLNIVPLSGVLEELDAAILQIERKARAARVRTLRAATRRRRRSGGPGLTVEAPEVARESVKVPSPTTRSGTSRSSSTSTACAGSTSPSSSSWSGTPTARPRIAFRPDFYLPDHGCFIELTTLSQKLVTRKNAKVRRLRELHPGSR